MATLNVGLTEVVNSFTKDNGESTSYYEITGTVSEGTLPDKFTVYLTLQSTPQGGDTSETVYFTKSYTALPTAKEAGVYILGTLVPENGESYQVPANTAQYYVVNTGN